jgi:beta-glucuronidase
MTEFGAEATMDGPANVKETYAFQRDYLRRNLEIVARHPWLSGAIYWTLREFAVKPAWDGGAERDVARDSIHNKGLLHYENGQPKPAWQVALANFGSTPLYRTATPRAVSAALDARPPGPEASAATVGLAGAIGALLLALGGLLVWAMRGVWQFGDTPAPLAAAEPLEPGERRLRAVA